MTQSHQIMVVSKPEKGVMGNIAKNFRECNLLLSNI